MIERIFKELFTDSRVRVDLKCKIGDEKHSELSVIDTQVALYISCRAEGRERKVLQHPGISLIPKVIRD